MQLNNKILAIIWDFDGTIADSKMKNFSITKKLMIDIVGPDSKKFPVLQSLDDYHSAHIKAINWRDFYKDSFNLTEEQVNKAGRLWTEYQLKDQNPVPIINGVGDTIKLLSAYPQGIVSQNSRENIVVYLNEKKICKYFQTVVGYEEVHITKQKPIPDGLLLCVEKLVNSDNGYIFYIGDHETDARCVKNANDVLANKNPNLKIVSIGAFYGYEVDTSTWSMLPDLEVRNAEKIPETITHYLNDQS